MQTLRYVLEQAQRNGVAIGHFNIADSVQLNAVFAAARELNLPVVIGVSDEPEAKVQSLADPKIGYFSAIDTQGRTKKALEVSGIPHVIILDPQGVVRWEGFPFLKGFELSEKVVEEILAAK